MDEREFVAKMPEISTIVRGHVLKYNLPSMTHEDLSQEALLALWQALEKFDPERGSFKNFVHGITYRHLAMVASTALAKKRTPDALVPLRESCIPALERYMEPDEEIHLDLTAPDFDIDKVQRRNQPRNETKIQIRVMMTSKIHISPTPEDLAFIRDIPAQRQLDTKPAPEYWEEPDYWKENTQYRRIIERYSWGCVIFLSSKSDDLHCTVVSETMEFEESLKKYIPWYSQLIEHFENAPMEKPPCLGRYEKDPVCDGGFNERLRLVEKPCSWCEECRKLKNLPKPVSLQQLANNIFAAVSEISEIPIATEPTVGQLYIEPIKSKVEKGAYLCYKKEDDPRVSIMVIRIKKRNLSVGVIMDAKKYDELEPVNWGRYRAAVKTLRTEEQMEALIEAACDGLEEVR